MNTEKIIELIHGVHGLVNLGLFAELGFDTGHDSNEKWLRTNQNIYVFYNSLNEKEKPVFFSWLKMVCSKSGVNLENIELFLEAYYVLQVLFENVSTLNSRLLEIWNK